MSAMYDLTTVHHILNNGTREEILEMLQHKIDFNCTNKNGDTALHAVFKNDKLLETDLIDILTSFLSQGVNPNLENNHEQTALHLAVEKRMKDVVNCLLEFQVDIQSVNKYGNSIAHFFIEDEYEKGKLAMRYPLADTVENCEKIESGSVSFLEYLISKGVSFGRKNIQGESPLHLAITYQLLDILPKLLENVNDLKCGDNETLLELYLEGSASASRLSDEHHYYGCDSEHADKVLKMLLDRVTFIDSALISKAIGEKRQMSIIETLINYYLNNVENPTSLFHALMDTCQLWDSWQTDYFITVLWDLVAQGVIVNNPLSQKGLLITAMEAKNLRLLEFLKENGVDFGLRFARGKKLLHLFAEKRDCKALSNEFCRNLCEFLVSCGCGINDTDNQGKTALHTAVGYGNFPMAQILIENGAEINCRDQNKKTPLHEAVMMNKSLEFINLLLSSGANVNVEDYQKETPLYIAISKNNATTVRLLIDYGASVNVAHPRLQSPLHDALLKRVSAEIVELLLTSGADVKVKDYKGKTPLHLAVSNNEVSVVELLLTNGADVNAKDYEGNRPLHQVFKRPDIEPIFNTLLKKGAYVNAQNHQGESALYHALKLENRILINELLKYNADLNDPKIRELLFSGSRSLQMIPLLTEHWIKLSTANFPIDKTYRAHIQYHNYHEYHNQCFSEIKKLQSTIIDGCHSLYSFLQMNPEQRYVYVNSENLQQFIESSRLDQQFPKYANIILANYRMTKIFETREKVSIAMTEIFCALYNVKVDEIVAKIVNFLKDEDLFVSGFF